jgi:hypothetical protein
MGVQSLVPAARGQKSALDMLGPRHPLAENARDRFLSWLVFRGQESNREA